MKVISILSLLILVVYYGIHSEKKEPRATNMEFKGEFVKEEITPVSVERKIANTPRITVQELKIPREILERISLSEKEKLLLQALIIRNEWDEKVAAILILSRFMNLFDVVNYVRQLKSEIKSNPTESLKSLQLTWSNLLDGNFIVERANCILLAYDLKIDRAD